MRGQDLEIQGMVSIFNYMFDKGADSFKQAGVELISLTEYPTLLNLAIDKGLVKAEEKEVLLNWRQDPANWMGVH